MTRVNKVTALAMTMAVFLLSADTTHSAEPLFEKADIFISGSDKFHTYRQPAITVTNKGTILAFCEAHRYDADDMGDVDIQVRRSLDGGKTWGEPITVWDQTMMTCSNPTVVVERDSGRIWVLMGWKYYADSMEDILKGEFLTNTGRMNRTFSAYLKHSNDDGVTWMPYSSLEDTTAKFKKPEWRYFSPGAGAGIQLQNGPQKGRLIFPCSASSLGKDVGFAGFSDIYTIHDYVHFGSYIVYSDDQGGTWKRGEEVIWPWKGKCQVVELSDGRLMLNMQNYYRKEKCRAVATSEDGGKTWSAVTYDTALTDPISAAGFVQYTREATDDRNRLLFSNPAHPDTPMNLTVRMSYDNGQFWPVRKVIEPGLAGDSAMAVLKDRSIGLVYEQGSYAKVVFTRFNLEWLSGGSDRLPHVQQSGLPEFPE